MWRQVLVLLSAVTVCLALGNGRAHYSTKNVFQKQAPQQYASVASYHSTKSAQPQVQAAPSPYSFGYEADGSARQESSDASGKVTGSYKVTNEDGSVRVVNYVADDQGFRADIDTNEPGTKSENPADVALKSAAVEKAPAAGPSKYSAQSYSQSTAYKSQYEQKPIQFNMGPNGGAYSYNYEAQLEDGGSSSHSESSDGSGKVSGFYSMNIADGRKRKVDYTVDNEGFRASVNTNEFGTKSDSPAHVQFLSTAPLDGPAASSFAHSTSSQQQKQVKMYAPAISQEPIQAAPFSDSKPSPYAFSYDAQLEDGSSSRTESADASGKVVGSYSLQTADGRKRKIDYEADHEGFRASVNTNEFGTKNDSPADVQFYSSAPQEAPAPSYAAAPKAAALPVQHSRVTSSSGIKSTVQAPGGLSNGFKSSYQGQSSVHYSAAAAVEKPSPYSFNYMADLDDGSISRSESADGSGKVIGSYSLSVADGRQRKVDYTADEGGFRASVNTNEFGTKSDSPADVQFYSSATFDEPAPYSSPNAYKASSSSGASTYSSGFQAQQQVAQSPIQFNTANGAGAYSYNYQAQLEDGGSSAHSESSDGPGKVSGFYSMSVADGRRRKVDYTADNGGFQAKVDTNEFGTKSDSPAHVQFYSSAPQEPLQAPVAPRAPVAFKAPAGSQAAGSAGMYKTSFVSQQRVEPVQSFAPSPYAFGYEAEATGGSSARNEAGDASGTVTGSYTVRNEDGSVRVVEYVADKDGFRANVKTNEPGTKSDHPADVVVKSDAPASAPVQQQPLKAQFPARTNTPKSSMISQKAIDAWSR